MSDDLIRQIRDAKPPRRGRPPGPRKVRLSVDVLPETKKALAAISRRGWPAEYCPEQGVPSYLRDEQTGDQIDIPDAVWSDAMASVA